MSEIRAFNDRVAGKVVTDRNRKLDNGEVCVEGQVLSRETATGLLRNYNSSDGGGFVFYGIANQACDATLAETNLDVIVNCELYNAWKLVFENGSDTFESIQELARAAGINLVRFQKRQFLSGEDSE